MQIVLASASPYRSQLLRRILDQFTTDSADIDESPYNNEQAAKLAIRLAASKAQKVASRHNNALIIGSDQVAVLESNTKPLIMGKPGGFEQAFTQLQQCSGHTVVFHTACCLIDTQHRTQVAFIDKYAIKFNKLDDNQIKNYWHKEQPYDCAGSIKSEALGIALIEKFIGNDPSTLIGLPLIKLVCALAQFGVKIL